MCAPAWLALFPGLNLPGYSPGVENEALAITIFLRALVTFVLTVISAYAHDAQRTNCVEYDTGRQVPRPSRRTNSMIPSVGWRH